jgi:hypothetical protein
MKQDSWLRFCFIIFFWLLAGWGFLALVGCSGSSTYSPVAPLFPTPTTLSLSGSIDLREVAVHPDLGGTYSSIRAQEQPLLRSLLNFKVIIEDEATPAAEASAIGVFAFAKPMTVRDQLVLQAVDTSHAGLILEQMMFHPLGLRGNVTAKITVLSTARSFIAKALRNRYGLLVDPALFADSVILPVAEAIYAVLEKQPGQLSAQQPLEAVPEVAQAVTAQATAIAAQGKLAPPREWLILVYQGADSTLEQSLLTDLNELKAVALSSQAEVLVQIDTPHEGIRRLQIRKDSAAELVSLGSGNSADPRKIADFVHWGQRRFPARRTALILASHGLGWRSAVESRGVMIDDSEAGYLTMTTLKTALRGATQQAGGFVRPLDLLGFDACLMGLFEIAYQIRETNQFLVFSQGNEPGNGWAYDRILQGLAKNYAMDGEALGKTICSSYKDFYQTPALASRYSGTLSLIRSANLPALQEAFSTWAGTLYQIRQTPGISLGGIRDALFTDGTRTGSERYRVQAFEYTDYRDLADLVQATNEAMPETRIDGDRLRQRLADTVAFRVQFGEKFSRAQGLSISLPSPGHFPDYSGHPVGENYADLDIAAETQWDELLAYINISSFTPKVDGRGLFVDLVWNNQADIDLYIGEPDPAYPLSPEKIVWFAPSEGAITTNGRFSADSHSSGQANETWFSNATINAGHYWVLARYFSRSMIRQAANLSVAVGALNLEHTVEKAGLQPGEQFEAVKITVASDRVTVQNVSSASLPLSVLKSFDKALTLQAATK